MQAVERNTIAHSLQWRIPHTSANIYRCVSGVFSLCFEQILTLISMYISLNTSFMYSHFSHSSTNSKNTHLLTCLLGKGSVSLALAAVMMSMQITHLLLGLALQSLSASLSLSLWLVKLIGSPSVLHSHIYQKLNGLLYSSWSMCPSWIDINCGKLFVCDMKEGGIGLVSCNSVLQS